MTSLSLRTLILASAIATLLVATGLLIWSGHGAFVAADSEENAGVGLIAFALFGLALWETFGITIVISLHRHWHVLAVRARSIRIVLVTVGFVAPAVISIVVIASIWNWNRIQNERFCRQYPNEFRCRR